MEHYRSTLATAAVASLGLVVAAHILHPGNYEQQPRRVQPVVAQADAASVMMWQDPPRVFAVQPTVAEPNIADPVVSVLSPRMTIPLASGSTMAAIVPAKMATTRVARVGTPRPRKTTMPTPDTRQASLASERAKSATPVAPPAAKSGRGPLDVLFHDLGLSSDSEG